MIHFQRFVAHIHRSTLSHRGAPATPGAMLANVAAQRFGGPVWMHQVLLDLPPQVQGQVPSTQLLPPQQSAPARLAPGLMLPGPQVPAASGRGNAGPFPAMLAAPPPPTAQPGPVAVAGWRQPPTATRDGRGPGVATAAATAAQGLATVIDSDPEDGNGNAPATNPSGANPRTEPGITLQPAAAAERPGIQNSMPAHNREAGTAAASAPFSRVPGLEGDGAAAEALLSLAADAQSKLPQTAHNPLQVAGVLANKN